MCVFLNDERWICNWGHAVWSKGVLCALEVTCQQWMKPVIFHAFLLVVLFVDNFFLKMGVLDCYTTNIYFPIMNGKRKN